MNADTQPMTESESAFWLFFDTAHEAHLSATDCAAVVGIARATWYTWTGKDAKPYGFRIERIKRAHKLLRADLAEKILPAKTNAKRRELVAALVAKLDEGEEEKP